MNAERMMQINKKIQQANLRLLKFTITHNEKEKSLL